MLDVGLQTFELGIVSGEAQGEALEPLRGALRSADGLARDGHLHGGGSAASFCSLAWLFWHLSRLPEASRRALLADAEPHGATIVVDGSWAKAMRIALDNFGCHWGFSARLPAGVFR